MKLTVRMTLNKLMEITTDFEADDLQDLIRKAGVFLDFEGKCGLCSSELITLKSRRSKEGHKYTEYTCMKCGARQRWGTLKDGSGNFLKSDWEEKYNGEGSSD